MKKVISGISTLMIISICLYIASEFADEAKEIAGEDSYAHNASKSGVEALENLEEGAELVRDVEKVLPKK